MTLRFLVAEGFTSLRRVAAASVIGALLTGVALAVVGGLALVALAYRSELSLARTSATVEVFLSDSVDAVRSREIASAIKTFPSVRSTRVRSREESERMFDIQSVGDSSILSGGIPLPTTIQVELSEDSQSLQQMTEIGTRLRRLAGVEDVSFPGELIRVVEERSSLFLRIAIVIGTLLCASVIGVVANTAQLTVISRRSVIRTMKLLGAERRWVIAPFIIQGFVIGLSGGIVAMGMLYGSWRFVPGLESMMQNTDLTLFPLLFLPAGSLLGILGAASASGYYVARQHG